MVFSDICIHAHLGNCYHLTAVVDENPPIAWFVLKVKGGVTWRRGKLGGGGGGGAHHHWHYQGTKSSQPGIMQTGLPVPKMMPFPTVATKKWGEVRGV